LTGKFSGYDWSEVWGQVTTILLAAFGLVIFLLQRKGWLPVIHRHRRHSH
jgi:hypothetical protein